jgi:hypothetical protein
MRTRAGRGTRSFWKRVFRVLGATVLDATVLDATVLDATVLDATV